MRAVHTSCSEGVCHELEGLICDRGHPGRRFPGSVRCRGRRLPPPRQLPVPEATCSPRSPSPRSAARESMQDVPISMQAFTGQTLQQLNVSTFDDYIKYLPNVTTANNGPGQNEVFMRGLSAGSQPSQGSASTGLVSERRHLSRQPVRPAAESQSRHLCRRSEPHRGAGGPAGHAVRRRRRGGRDPLHHQRAEARRDRGSVKAGYGITAHGDHEHRRHRGAEPAADRRAPWRCAR